MLLKDNVAMRKDYILVADKERGEDTKNGLITKETVNKEDEDYQQDKF